MFNDSMNWTTTITINISGISARHTLAFITPLLAVRIFVVVSAFCLNTALLITHIMKPAYINQFTIYLLFLYIANTVYLAGASPFMFFSDVYSIDISSFGMTNCMVFGYFHYVVSLIPVMGHLLIALNRLWAVQFPHNYRVYHTEKAAWLICLGMVLYVHVVKMPPFLLYEPLAYQTTLTTPPTCTRLAPSSGFFYWSRTDSFLNRFAPMFGIILIYVYVMCKRLQKRKTVAIGADSVTNPPRRTINETDGAGSIPQASGRAGASRKNIVQPFFILTFTTVSVITCWMPLATLFVYQRFLGPKAPTAVSTAVQYCLFLYTLQMLFDPLMWIFGFQQVRYRRRGCSVFCK